MDVVIEKKAIDNKKDIIAKKRNYTAKIDIDIDDDVNEKENEPAIKIAANVRGSRKISAVVEKKSEKIGKNEKNEQNDKNENSERRGRMGRINLLEKEINDEEILGKGKEDVFSPLVKGRRSSRLSVGSLSPGLLGGKGVEQLLSFRVLKGTYVRSSFVTKLFKSFLKSFLII